MPARAGAAYVPGRIEIVTAANAVPNAMLSVHGHVAQTFDFGGRAPAVRVISVPAGTENAAIAALRSDPNVTSARRVPYRSVLRTTAALTNDTYYRGFTPSNTPPLYESASKPGQYDMHVICAANAWGYANANTTGSTHPAAQGGNASAPVAIIDTGADLTHPELTGRVTYAESDLNGTTTVGLASMHDNDGHGTNVAGIVGAAGNNAFGFVGVAYNAPLMIFKVFPDPPAGGCAPGSLDPGCEASSSDIALAIQHAVNRGAKVINLSLGASTPATSEENAIAAAIGAGVVVVAAAGNDSRASLDYPAADPGVIAVGASSIDDTNPVSPHETVASYSDYDASNPQTWGVVAPGGDPSGSSDADDLHWIENIYTSTAADGSGQPCTPDYLNPGTPNDCRILIAGTSQASPHVAGAAAVLLALGAAPNNVKSLMCSTANGMASSKAGCGRLNLYAAAAKLLGDTSP